MRSRGISQTKAQIVFARDRYTCVYCGKKAIDVRICHEGRYNRPYFRIFDESGTPFEIDHVIPFSLGGTNEYNNLATSCWKCNNTKSNRHWKFTPPFTLIYKRFVKGEKYED